MPVRICPSLALFVFQAWDYENDEARVLRPRELAARPTLALRAVVLSRIAGGHSAARVTQASARPCARMPRRPIGAPAG